MPFRRHERCITSTASIYNPTALATIRSPCLVLLEIGVATGIDADASAMPQCVKDKPRIREKGSPTTNRRKPRLRMMSGRIGRHCHGPLYRGHCTIGPCPGCDCKIPLNTKSHNWRSFACTAWKPELDTRQAELGLIVFEPLLTLRIWFQLMFRHI